MLFGRVPFTIFLFFRLPPHRAVLVSVIGGWLFLPMTGYDFSGLPSYSKSTAIALGLFLGGRISGQRRRASFQWKVYDTPLLLWCLCPIASSLSNQLGVYDGLSGIVNNTITWGIPYLAGRIYFNSLDKLHDFCLAIMIGGLLYLPLCLYEIRMSPQLSNIFYGFFPHSFMQHIRYGGYRPIVFMQHGLMVALWMAVTTTVAFWFWRSKEIRHIKAIPFSFAIVALIVTTILCKSAGAWTSLALGCGGYFFFRFFKSGQPIRLLLLLIPCYMLLRITGGVSGGTVEDMANRIFDADRTSSLAIRLVQEDLFIEKTLERPLLGGGIIGRVWPRDPETGETTVGMIDSLWLVIFSTRGIIGIFFMATMMLIGPWLVLRPHKKEPFNNTFSRMGPILLSLIVILFLIDCLVNGMLNPIYILVSGALLGWHVNQAKLLADGETLPANTA